MGYDVAEQAHAFLLSDTEWERSINPGLAVWPAGDDPCADVGRVILGAESFRLHAQTGAPAKLVWKTGAALTANVYDRGRAQPFQTMRLRPETVVRIKLGERELGVGKQQKSRLTASQNRFSKFPRNE